MSQTIDQITFELERKVELANAGTIDALFMITIPKIGLPEITIIPSDSMSDKQATQIRNNISAIADIFREAYNGNTRTKDTKGSQCG